MVCICYFVIFYHYFVYLFTSLHLTSLLILTFCSPDNVHAFHIYILEVKLVAYHSKDQMQALSEGRPGGPLDPGLCGKRGLKRASKCFKRGLNGLEIIYQFDKENINDPGFL